MKVILSFILLISTFLTSYYYALNDNYMLANVFVDYSFISCFLLGYFSILKYTKNNKFNFKQLKYDDPTEIFTRSRNNFKEK